MTLATFYSAVIRQVETGEQIILQASEQPLSIPLVGEAIHVSTDSVVVEGRVLSRFTTIGSSVTPSGHTNRTFVHQVEVANDAVPKSPSSLEEDTQIAKAISELAAAQGKAGAATIWSERLTVRNPVGANAFMGSGQIQDWRPGVDPEGSLLLGPLNSSLPPSDARQPCLAISFHAIAGRHYILSVTSEPVDGGPFGEAQVQFFSHTSASAFGDLRANRTYPATIAISAGVTAGQQGHATAYVGWLGFEDSIVSVSLHEVQL